MKIESFEIYNDWDVPNLNLDKNFEIITWNCEFFPTADEQTIKALSEIIQAPPCLSFLPKFVSGLNKPKTFILT